MRTFLAVSPGNPSLRRVMEVLKSCGFYVIPNSDPKDTALYCACLVGVHDHNHSVWKELDGSDLIPVVIGNFDDQCPRHIHSNGTVFIDIRSGRIVSHRLFQSI